MRAVRLLLVVIYIGYLVQAGLLMVMLPWSEVWSLLLLRLPLSVAAVLDAPAIRGLITAFGILHLALVMLEVGRTARSDANARGKRGVVP